MNRTLLICFLTFSVNIFAQSENIIIGLPNSESIYTGYDNLIKVSFNKKRVKNISLTCEGCDTIRPFNLDKNEWLVRANRIGAIIITAKDKKDKEIGAKPFQVMQPPVPTVFLDSINAQSFVSEIPTKIKLELHPSVPVKMGFIVRKWTIILNGITLDGSGSMLSEDVKTLLRKDISGTLILSVDYSSAFGDGTVKEIFQYQIK
jgi:hypothetical protein